MKISRYITLNIFNEIFGTVKVLDTARKLRKSEFTGGSALSKHFPQRTTELDGPTAGAFLYVLMAQRTPKDVPAIVQILNEDQPYGKMIDDTLRPLINVIGQYLFDRDLILRDCPRFEVSKRNGEAKLFVKGGHPQGEYFDRQEVAETARESFQSRLFDYDGALFDRDLYDTIEVITWPVLLRINNAIRKSAPYEKE